MKNKFNRIKHNIEQAIRALSSTGFKDSIGSITECDVLFFCGDGNRGLLLDGKPYSPLIDTLRQGFENRGLECITIANPLSVLVGDKAYGHPLSFSRAVLTYYALDKLFSFSNSSFLRKYYKDILAKANPSLIVSIGCSNELCYAARSLSIFHSEILHGIGYPIIPWNWDSKKIEFLPQSILALDSISKETFLPLANKGIEIIKVKHPFLNRFAESHEHKLPREWLLKEKDTLYKKEILVSLQWGFDYDIDKIELFKGILSNGLFHKELEEVINHTKESILWRFRLHPVQLRNPKKYKRVLDYINNFVEQNENCEIDESSSLPLPSILSRCSGHLTMSSMVSYEAAYQGIQTLALSPLLCDAHSPHSDLFLDLIHSGYLIKSKPSVQNILDWAINVEKLTPFLDIENGVDATEWLIEKSLNKSN